MAMPELPDMGDPIPREGPTPSQCIWHRNALLFSASVSPWIFLYVATRNIGLIRLAVLNLISTYLGLHVIVRSWRRNRMRRAYVALAGSLGGLIVWTSSFKILN